MNITIEINIEIARKALGISGLDEAYKDMTDEQVKEALFHYILEPYGIKEQTDERH